MSVNPQHFGIRGIAAPVSPCNNRDASNTVAIVRS
jgi:hypothetical protein